MNIDELRLKYGFFLSAPFERRNEIVNQIEDAVIKAMSDLDLSGFKELAKREARLDFASDVLSIADGYRRRIASFKDLSWAELEYISAIANDPMEVKLALERSEWLPTMTKRRINKLLRTDRVGTRSKNKLVERLAQ